MNKILSTLIIGAFPIIALGAGEHPSGHGGEKAGAMPGHNMPGHNMADMHKKKEAHASMAGKPGESAKVSRTVDIVMNDSMRFSPQELAVKAGETIRFLVKNDGKLEHEMVIGTMDELKEHAEIMRKAPGMKHAEANMVTLDAGKRGRILWQFDKAGTINFACLVPGHMEAGMVGSVTVK